MFAFLLSIPSSVKEALLIPHWKDAKNEQMKALEKSKTLKLMKPPEGKKKVVGHKKGVYCQE